MAFQLDAHLEPIHQPVRLRLMTLLWRHRDVGFAQARDALQVTDGNLGAHAKVLEAAGFLRSRQVLLRRGFQMRYEITEAGAAAFKEYLRRLQEFLRAVEA